MEQMNSLQVKEVEFNGNTLLAAQESTTDKIYVGVKWVCQGIGLSEGQAKHERRKLKDDAVLSKGGRNLVLPTSGGKQDVLAIELDFLPLWLAKISITPNMQKENPEVAQNLISYQLKAKDVLAEAFLPKKQYSCVEDVLIQSLQEMKEVKQQIRQTNDRIDGISDIVALNTNSWREDARHLIVRIAQARGGNEYIRDVQAEIFQLVDARAKVSLTTRLTNKRRRMADEGVCKSKRDKLNRVDVIADDKKLIEIYVAIVKEMAVKYGLESM